MLNRKSFLLMLIPVFLLACGAMNAFKTYNQKDVAAADKSGDEKTLQGVCKGTLKEEEFSGAKKLACSLLERKAGRLEVADLEKKNDHAGLDKICMDKQRDGEVRKDACDAKARVIASQFAARAASCESVREAWAWRAALDTGSPRKVVMDPAWSNKAVSDAAIADYELAFEKYIACGLWNEAFEDLLGYHPGGWDPDLELPAQVHVGHVALKGRLDAGVKVEEKLVEYLKKAGKEVFPKNHAASIEELVKFLVMTTQFKQCTQLAALAATADADTIHQWLPFFEVAGCKEGRAIAVTNLASGKIDQRIRACRVLGVIGTKAELAKVKAVAEGDGYNKIVKKVQIYPVRDACGSSVSNITVRGK